ncbi:MAG: helix-turn-helix domain-containing protein, partial [Clostridia bacterium]|nr:helix-turn-helix domain-containing protein [Clostridia bacterium]
MPICGIITVKHNLRIGGKMKNNIVVLRKQNKIKQQQLAAAVGVSRQSIYSIEKCKFLPTV